MKGEKKAILMGGEEEKKEVVFFYRSERAQLECRRERFSPTGDREKLHSMKKAK